MMTPALPASAVVERAAASRGGSSDAIYRMVARALAGRTQRGGVLLDVGCGHGGLREHIAGQVDEYVGADVIRYDGFPAGTRFFQIDLDAGRVPLPDASVETVVAVETVEHLENPRAFFRELRRLLKPSGTLLATTPNQLSLLSLLTLLTKGQFNAFQEVPGLYPAHLTALLEIDLQRITRECGLEGVEIRYSNDGRMPFSARKWPAGIFRGRLFSDNLLVAARAPDYDETPARCHELVLRPYPPVLSPPTGADRAAVALRLEAGSTVFCRGGPALWLPAVGRL